MLKQKNQTHTHVLIAISAIFISIGAYRGEVATVLKKAISICLECIGVG